MLTTGTNGTTIHNAAKLMSIRLYRYTVAFYFKDIRTITHIII